MPSNLPEYTDTIGQVKLKLAMNDWLDSIRPTHAITLSWNRDVGLNRARDDLRNLMHRVDRTLLGSRFHKIPSEYRTFSIFFFEGQNHNHTHVHSLWRTTEGKWFNFGKMFPAKRGGVWNTVVESGSYDVEGCSFHGRNPEITGYISKQYHRFSDPSLMVLSSEFHRSA